MARLNASDRKAALEAKRRQIEAQLKALDAREGATKRKEDTRRKIVAGALALEHMEKHPSGAFAVEFRKVLGDFVDLKARHLFPFLSPLPGGSDAGKKPASPPAAVAAAAAPQGKDESGATAAPSRVSIKA